MGYRGWQPIVNARVVNLPYFLDVQHRFFDSGYDDVLVTEVREGNEYSVKVYWIHCAGHINAIVCNGVVKGQGSKKYEKDVLKAVELFQLNGENREKFVKYPPYGMSLYRNPAIMYDSTDYTLLHFGDIEKLETMLSRKNYLTTKWDSSNTEVKVNHGDVCILKLPIDQNLVNDIWNWKGKALRDFIEIQLNRFM